MNAVITGASKGLGRAIAAKLASNGYDLFIGARNADELKFVGGELAAEYGVSVHYCAADLSMRKELSLFAEQVKNTFPKIDVLINNAGLFLPGQIIKEAEGVLEHQMNTNLYSAYHLTRALMSNILSGSNAHIINMCSIASKIAYPNGSSYSISKFALLGFSKVLREELKPMGVKVTAILPGATWSNSWAGVDLPQERLMEANDIAEAVIACLRMSHSACVEEIIMRPQLGDL